MENIENKDERLINEVEKFKCLYVTTRSDFKDQLKKENAWRTIGEAFGRDGGWACKRFKYLRDTYTRKRRELVTKSGQEAQRMKKWQYFDMMGFLDPYTKYQTTEGNYQGYEADERNQDLAGEGSAHLSPPTTSDRQTPVHDVPGPSSSGRQTPVSDVSRSSSPGGQMPVSETQRNSKKRRQNIPPNERSEMIEALKCSTDAIVSRKPKHECLVWAESIGMRMMAMNPRERSLVRLRVEQMMFDVEFGNQQINSLYVSLWRRTVYHHVSNLFLSRVITRVNNT